MQALTVTALTLLGLQFEMVNRIISAINAEAGRTETDGSFRIAWGQGVGAGR
jgi:hypothetical protein